MNKFIRALLIVFAVCLAIGGGTLIAGVAMGGTFDDATVQFDGSGFGYDPGHGLLRFGDVSDDDDDDDDDDDGGKDGTGVKGDFVADMADIKDLDMLFCNCDVEIIQTSDETLRVETEESGRKYISIKMDGDTLKIKDTRKKSKTIKTKSVKMKIYVPKLLKFREVDFDMGAGNIEIDMLNAECISIEGGAGSLQADTLVALELDMDMGVGDLQIREAVLGEVDISCGAGSVRIDRCTLGGDLDVSGGVGDVDIGIDGTDTDFNYELECGMGELSVFGTSYSSLGKEKEIDNGASYTISLECGIGSIDVHEANL